MPHFCRISNIIAIVNVDENSITLIIQIADCERSMNAIHLEDCAVYITPRMHMRYFVAVMHYFACRKQKQIHMKHDYQSLMIRLRLFHFFNY